MPNSIKPTTDQLAAVRQMIAGSGLAEARAERDEAERLDAELLARLQLLTRQENRARASAAGDLALEDLIGREESGESLRDEIARVQGERTTNARRVLALRRRDAEITADLEPRVRLALLTAHQERAATAFSALFAAADALRAIRLANADIEMLLDRAGLRPLGLEILLPGVDMRLSGSDGQAAWLDELAKEWSAAGWLVGDVAQYAEDRRLAAFADRERIGRERAERRAESQRQSEAEHYRRQREMVQQGTVRVYSMGRLLPVAEALDHLDVRFGVKPASALRGEPELAEGALIG